MFLVLDSSSKIPSGMLQLNAADFGDYDECIEINSGEDFHIRGKYCSVGYSSEVLALLPVMDNDGLWARVCFRGLYYSIHFRNYSSQ